MLGWGRVLLGGAPLRILRLSDAGAQVVRDLFRGSAVGDGPNRAALARRLVALGLAHPVAPPDPAAGRGDLVVVIPVKDDHDAVARTLDALLAGDLSGHGDDPAPPERPVVVVVDDGSSDPEAVVAAVAGRGRVVRRAVSGGPGAARTSGLAAVGGAPLVAFVDAGVEVGVADLRRLAGHLVDPVVAAAAPRIASVPAPGRIARYESARSPLDLGSAPGPARPGSPVPYVPTACLVVRTGALDQVGGFDPTLRYGEDVDLVWRLVAQGFDVRYDPTVVATHPPRPTLRGWVRQRVAYGSSAGPLARRHGSVVSPSRCSGWSLAVWASTVAGHPVAAAALVGWTARSLRSKLDALPEPALEAVRLTVAGHWRAGRNLSRQLLRTWWPLTVLAALRSRQGRRLLVVGVAASAADHWAAGRGHRLHTVALGLVDDVAYGAGVWWGLRRGAGAAAVLPNVVAWPVDRRDGPAAGVTER